MPINKTLAVSLIDDPQNAMRTEIDDDYIVELAADIKKNGLINPLAVRQTGQRYELIAGHCRLIAIRSLGNAMVEVRDYTGDAVEPEAIKCRENLGRRDVSDADTALYLSELVDKHNYDSERLIAITGKSENWISTRLALFRGDPRVFEALRKNLINLGTATALNKFPDDYRLQYLDICINTTPPIRMVNQWLDQLKMMQLAQPVSQADGEAGEAPALPPGVVIEACEICRSGELNWTMKFYRIHEHCMRMITDALEAQQKG